MSSFRSNFFQQRGRMTLQEDRRRFTQGDFFAPTDVIFSHAIGVDVLDAGQRQYHPKRKKVDGSRFSLAEDCSHGLNPGGSQGEFDSTSTATQHGVPTDDLLPMHVQGSRRL